uniref:Uncharacterized protein n=1 Tax=Anguilla anguilla TaxID=7936 RepID=A0A0E9TTG4_ANGAN
MGYFSVVQVHFHSIFLLLLPSS